MELSLGTKLKTFLDTCSRECPGGSIWQLRIFVAKNMTKSTFALLQMDVIFTVFKGIGSKLYAVVTWSLPKGHIECVCERWTKRLEMAWCFPPSSAIIKAVGELGVLRSLQHIVEALKRGPGDKLRSDDNVIPMKPKTAQLETVHSWCRRVVKAVQKEHWRFCEKKHSSMQLMRIDFRHSVATKTYSSLQRTDLFHCIQTKSEHPRYDASKV